LDKVVARRDTIFEEARKSGITVTEAERKSAESVNPKNVEVVNGILNRVEDKITKAVASDRYAKNVAELSKAAQDRVKTNRADYDQVLKRYDGGLQASRNIAAIAANFKPGVPGNGIDDNALMAAFDALRSNKSSVLREGDEDRLTAAAGLQDRLFNIVAKFQTGEKLTPATRAALVRVSKLLGETIKSNLKNDLTPIYKGTPDREKEIVFSPSDLESFGYKRGKGSEKTKAKTQAQSVPMIPVSPAQFETYVRRLTNNEKLNLSDLSKEQKEKYKKGLLEVGKKRNEVYDLRGL
jgi:hypothetical protein